MNPPLSTPWRAALVLAGLALFAVFVSRPGSTCASGCFPLASAFAAEPVDGEKAVAWTLEDLRGNTVKSSEFDGKVVVLNFWATWCPPCRAEIPGFVALQDRYAKEGLQILGVSLDQGSAASVEAFGKKMGINYPLLAGTEEIVSAFGGVRALPTTVILDRKGNVVDRHEGYLSKDDLEKAVQSLL